MNRPRFIPWLLLAPTIGFGVTAQYFQERNGRSWTYLVSDFTTGTALIFAGLMIWHWRGRHRCGVLLVIAAYAWWLGTYVVAPQRDLSLIAFACDRWVDIFLWWAVLAFPSGRIENQNHRRILCAAAGLIAIRMFSRVFLHVPPDAAGYGTRNRFLSITDDRWWRFGEDWFRRIYPLLLIGLLASVAFRWLRSSPLVRRMLLPVLVSALALCSFAAAEHTLGWMRRIPGTDVPVYHVRYWATGLVAAALVVGFARLRQARSSVVDLISEMNVEPHFERLGLSLAKALGDSTLNLYRWSPVHEQYVDTHDTIVTLNNDVDRAVTYINREGQPLAVMVHDPALSQDPGLVNAVAATIRLNADNEQLRRDLGAQLAEVAASRLRIIEAGDAERRRVERNLHDGAQQRLVTVALSLRLAEQRITAGSTDGQPIGDVLNNAVAELSSAIDELRDLARGIHPAALTESGLAAALEVAVDRAPIPVELVVDIAEEPPAAPAAAAYYAVAEALTNVAKHARATRARVEAFRCNGRLQITVTDNGIGGATSGRAGSGLGGISDRVTALDGTLDVISNEGCGTTIVVNLPCS